MSQTKAKFRTNQDDNFEPDDMPADDFPPQASNAKFFAVLAVVVVIAASLATLLSVTF
jgi:hypothetical protein